MRNAILATVLAVSCRPARAETLTFTYLADASAGEWLGGGFFVAASDEDNALRIYRVPEGGAPLASWDPSALLALDGKSPELDIEGSARVGDTIYWITSHAPNKEGKPRPNRRRFFATRFTAAAGAPRFALAGRPTATLIDALARDPRYAAFDLTSAMLRPPKTPASLNIEALCDTPGGGLLIGFRSPCPGGRALLAPLDNPEEVIAGRAPLFGPPALLDLGGNGLRAMARAGGAYLLLSGSPAAGGEARLYRWDGRGQPSPLPLPELPRDATPEGLVAAELRGTPALLILSDDGTRPVGGVPAKALPDPAGRSFRAFVAPVPTGCEKPCKEVP